jgi:hypothetical protein
MHRATVWMFAVVSLPSALVAQAAKSAPPATLGPLPETQQIASAIGALPPEFRETARVLGYKAGGKTLGPIREGGGQFTCLATEPGKSFHVACYQNSMEPFMLRGRELRAQGVKDPQVDTVRFAEVKSGKLVMPKQPAAMYQLFGGTLDPNSGAVSGARSLFVIYIPGATPATTGLSDKPAEGTPWIMFSGTPKAHIMLTPKM